METLVDRNLSQSVKKIIDHAFEGRSVPISRRVVLQHYFEKVIKNLPSLENVSRDDLGKALEKALADY